MAQAACGPQILTNKGRPVAIISILGKKEIQLSKETGANFVQSTNEFKKKFNMEHDLDLPNQIKTDFRDPFKE